MNRISVLYLIDSLGPGGAQRQLVTLLRSLDPDAVHPEVAYYHDIPHFEPELAERGVRLHRLGGTGGKDPRVTLSLSSLLRDGRYDILHSYLRTPGAIARVATIGSGVPVVVSERNVRLDSSGMRLFLERVLSRRAAAMVVNAEATAKEVRHLLPSWSGRVHVVPNGIEWREPTEAERAGARDFRMRHLGSSDVLLGAVGRVEEQKGPDVLVRALGELPAAVLERLKVVWVGPRVDGRLAESVERAAGASGLTDRFALLPETDDTRSVYLGVDCLILPSRWEGLPNVVMESLAHGTPVIATDVGDTAKLFPDDGGGWLVQPDDSNALAGTIVDMVNTTPEARAEAGAKGARFVLENYSSARLAERTLGVYRVVLNVSPGPGRR